MNEMRSDTQQALVDEIQSIAPTMPAHLGSVDYQIIPGMIGQDPVRFIWIPQMKMTGLTYKQSAVFGLLYRESIKVDEKQTMSRAQFRTAINGDLMKLCGLKDWSYSTRSRYLKAFIRAKIVKEAEDGFVLTLTPLFWKLPYAILARQDLSITQKVIWAALVFLSSNRKGAVGKIGLVPSRASLAQELGRSKSEKTNKMKKGFASVHLRHFRKIGLIRRIPGCSPHSGSSSYLVPVTETCGHDANMLTGDLEWACHVGQKKAELQGSKTLAKRCNDVCRLYHPAIKKALGECRDHQWSNSSLLPTLVQGFHALVRLIIDEIRMLARYATTAEDLLFLGFDDLMEITLFDVAPMPLHHDRMFRAYPAKTNMAHAEVVAHAHRSRKGIEEMLEKGVPESKSIW